MFVDAPGIVFEETKVMTDPMSTQVAAANLKRFIVIVVGKVRGELEVSLYRNREYLMTPFSTGNQRPTIPANFP